MNTKPSPRKPENVSPVFGLRYLEEEEAEVNGVNGCLMAEPRYPGETGSQYTTNCDYTDYD
ncbi:MAG TPA: herpeto-tandem family RiPP [Herpetosiphonaceae bacterium]